MSYDFSLSNPSIKSWFNEETGAAPIREFLYLHEHPLIRPNFISEVEVLIYETGLHMKAKHISGSPAKRLVGFAETFTIDLNDFVQDRSEELSEKVLVSLRNLYTLCTRIKAL